MPRRSPSPHEPPPGNLYPSPGASTEPADGARLAWLALDDLAPMPGNPRHRHKVKGLVASIRRHGFGGPLTVNGTTGHTLAGHGRAEALRAIRRAGDPPPAGIRVTEAGAWTVPALVGSWPEADERRLALALNGGPGGALLGADDPAAVAAIIAGAQGPDLAALGLTDATAARVVLDGATPVVPPALDVAELERAPGLAAGIELATVRLAVPVDLARAATEALRQRRTTAEAIIRAGLAAAEAAP